MDRAVCKAQLELFSVGSKEVMLDFNGGNIVSDAGLLPIAHLDRELGILSEVARRLSDPRTREFVTHSSEHILRQQVFQILAGYPDGNDAQLLRDDPLFKTLVGIDPDNPDRPLASGSTINRFIHSYTRREAEKPLEDRDVIYEVRDSQIQRIRIVNEVLVDTFVRTRLEQPTEIIVDMDPTDDPTHGSQQLSMFHGYYEQHQYFPMIICEGHTGMPLGAWLRSGTAGASAGAADLLKDIVDRVRQTWPNVKILVRGDSGIGCPEMYDYCEAAGLQYAIGYRTNPVLKSRIAELELEENARMLWWMTGNKHFQLFHSFHDYKADSWSHARHIITKVEITRAGGLKTKANIRHVVTNMPGLHQDIYHEFYTKRGNVPERPINEMKNGLDFDRLSSSRFLANGYKLTVHVLAYLLFCLYREAHKESLKHAIAMSIEAEMLENTLNDNAEGACASDVLVLNEEVHQAAANPVVEQVENAADLTTSVATEDSATVTHVEQGESETSFLDQEFVAPISHVEATSTNALDNVIGVDIVVTNTTSADTTTSTYNELDITFSQDAVISDNTPNDAATSTHTSVPDASIDSYNVGGPSNATPSAEASPTTLNTPANANDNSNQPATPNQKKAAKKAKKTQAKQPQNNQPATPNLFDPKALKARLEQLAKMEIVNARTQLFKVGARLVTSVRKIWFHASSTWPNAELLTTAADSVAQHIARLTSNWKKQGLYVSADELFHRSAQSATPSRIYYEPVPIQ